MVAHYLVSPSFDLVYIYLQPIHLQVARPLRMARGILEGTGHFCQNIRIVLFLTALTVIVVNSTGGLVA